jgi:hypothetical protein
MTSRAGNVMPSIAKPAQATSGKIELRLREVTQLFETLDPSPFHEQDLSRRVEAYIVDSARELPSKEPSGVVIYLDQPASQPDEERAVGDALRAHFARRALLLRRDLYGLLRRGIFSLAIGLAFLGVLLAAAQLASVVMAGSGFATVVRESLLIVGWVAMWRPLEIFLYDWWPIAGEQRLHERLSRIEVRIDPASSIAGR